MVSVHDSEKSYMEAFVIMKIPVFKQEPFFPARGRGGGWVRLISDTLQF